MSARPALDDEQPGLAQKNSHQLRTGIRGHVACYEVVARATECVTTVVF